MEAVLIIAACIAMFLAGLLVGGLNKQAARNDEEATTETLNALLDEIQVRDMADDFFPDAQDKRSRIAAVKYAVATPGSELYGKFDGVGMVRVMDACDRVLHGLTKKIIEERRCEREMKEQQGLDIVRAFDEAAHAAL